MIFVARQLLEKASEYQDSMFTLFADHLKEYDSVPREALQQVLEKSSAPTPLRILRDIKSAQL